ncbi:MAG: DNA mismatch repair endonuclease MutL [Lachnospiraceae bacterium]|nr:DNA mismatch repair endonuclease MutL [Lachnospiraceae bacterium]
MGEIHILDSETIDKIAAGEVVERPSSVVKELVENAIDAGANAITVEAKDGGIEFIRVTDNGAGIEREQLRKAFLRHATSKIENADDLTRIASLGFRGEALSSIAAVSRVEVITKRADTLVGNRILLEGGVEKSFEEVGAPDGTTFIVRNLFYNTPVRRKFLKQPATEGGYIADLMEHMALSRPDISFKFVLGNQTRFHTSGNGDLKEVIYRIYGREVASSLVPIQEEENGIRIEGYLGKPILVRSNRNFEIYFINGRFIKSTVVAKALEEGYKEYLMQHKFPLCVLHITMDAAVVDVNVHPTKMDVRFSNAIGVANFIGNAVRRTLKNREMIPDAQLGDEKEAKRQEREQQREAQKLQTPEPFEIKRETAYRVMEEARYEAVKQEILPKKESQSAKKQEFMQNPVWSRVFGKTEIEHANLQTQEKKSEVVTAKPQPEKTQESLVEEETFFVEAEEDIPVTVMESSGGVEERLSAEPEIAEVSQINLFEEKMLSVENRSRYQIIGQVFATYWLVQFEDKLFIIDQHAAHEKVKYERLMKQYQEKNVVSQTLMPPIIVSLSGQEESVLKEHREVFLALGFELEAFGGSEYALRSVPVDLYGCSEREMFLEVLDELAENNNRGSFKVVEEKIASMSCKAAVKGNNRLSRAEAEELIDELLTLENPYNCPHGRPTIISMSQSELEKKFKRIV